MQTIIDQVLEEEGKARQRVEEAKGKAASVRSAADQEADSVVARARVEASSATKERMETARRDAQKFVTDAVAEEERKNSSLYESARAKIPALAEEISAVIRATEVREA